MQTNNTKCGQCGYRSQDGAHCGLNGMPIDIEKDNCSFGKVSPPQCDICGQFMIGETFLEQDDDGWHHYCSKCSQLMGTCQICKHGKECRFETDTSITLPKIIQQQTRQGNMVMMQQVRNPARVEQTCKQGCPCYHEECECLKQYSLERACVNFVLNYR